MIPPYTSIPHNITPYRYTSFQLTHSTPTQPLLNPLSTPTQPPLNPYSSVATIASRTRRLAHTTALAFTNHLRTATHLVTFVTDPIGGRVGTGEWSYTRTTHHHHHIPTLSTHPLPPPSQHTLSTHPLNTPYDSN